MKTLFDEVELDVPAGLSPDKEFMTRLGQIELGNLPEGVDIETAMD